MSGKIKISVIVSCYNEEDSLPALYAELCQLKRKMSAYEFELLFVDDGSHDKTLTLIKGFASSDACVRYFSFSRNFGKEAAIYAGLTYCTGDYAVLMDADGQDPPSLLPEMMQCLESGEYDSVATRRVTRKGEPPIRSFFACLFYRIMNRISDVDLVDGARDYRLMNRRFLDALLSMGEYNRFSKGLFGFVGFHTKWLEYENIERAAGETKWSFWKLMLYALDGITAFSTIPLIISAVMGVACSFTAFVTMLVIIGRKLLFGDPVAGWASTICIVLFLGGLLMLFIGILGQYLAKVYLEVKKRPIYILAESSLADDCAAGESGNDKTEFL